MSRDVNKVILIGNTGRDPETRYLPNGNPVTSISLATNDIWHDKNTRTKQEKTEWHNLVFFGVLAETASRYLTKGTKIYVEGRLQTKQWEGNDGVKRQKTEVIVIEMSMLDSKPDVDQETKKHDTKLANKVESDDDSPF